MAEKEDYRKAKKEITKHFISRRRGIFTKTDLQQIIVQHVTASDLNQQKLLRGQMLRYMRENGKLKEVEFSFPARKETRYLLGNITEFELAQSLKPNAYLVHRAAMYLHGLCEEFPNPIYINVEQPRHHQRNKNSLTQPAIDQAFKNKARISNEIAEANGINICVTHGQRTDQLGVELKTNESGENLRVTCIERTLIDITVRPVYAGGPNQVLNAYRRAKSKISIQKMLKLLDRMDFVYPYHQSIGFYLDKSSVFTKKEVDRFLKIPIQFDFYLDNRIRSASYSDKWRIYYPKDLV